MNVFPDGDRLSGEEAGHVVENVEEVEELADLVYDFKDQSSTQLEDNNADIGNEVLLGNIDTEKSNLDTENELGQFSSFLVDEQSNL